MMKAKRECCPTCGRATPKPKRISARAALENFLQCVSVYAAWAADDWERPYPFGQTLAAGCDPTWHNVKMRVSTTSNPDVGDGGTTLLARVRGTWQRRA